MRSFDTTPEVKEFARNLLASNCLGNLEALNTDSGSEYIDHLVHVDPDAAMITIHRTIGGLAPEALQQITAGRRHLVWALEKLAFRHQSFDAAATLLRRLAASETEASIANNATGQFTQLYQLYLAGTEASLEMRLLVLDDGLRSSDQKERGVCIAALSKMLETVHFSRVGGSEGIGSHSALKDWAPSTYGEIWNFYRAALHRLTDIALGDDPFACQAKNIIGSHIRGLIGRLPFEEIRSTIGRIVSRDGFWPEAVEKVNEWLYFDRKKAPKELGQEVRVYFDELMPTDPVELAILYTNGWQTDFHDPDIDYDQEQASQHDFEYSMRKAIELADVVSTHRDTIDRALDRFVTSQGKSVFPFARRLAEVTADPRGLFKSAVERAELRQELPNLDFFGGLIAGIDSRDSEVARDCIRLALNSAQLKDNAISMIGSSKLQSSDIALVVSLLRSGDVKPWQCATLSYGRRMSHLAAVDILPLLGELSENGPDGLLAAIDIITMILHGDGELTGDLLSVLKDVLVDPILFDAAGHDRMMGHNVERMIALLVRRKLVDLPFAQALINQLLSICTPLRNNVFHDLSGSVRNSLRALIQLCPREVWISISKLLITDDYLVRHRIDWLLRRENDAYQGPGFLFDLPEALYLDWARKDPLHRASIVMKWLPITRKNDAGDLEWHPSLKNFISEFGDQDNVLGALSSRLHPLSWWGPLLPHLQPQLKLLESWLAHPNLKIRQWARDRMNWIKTKADVE